MRGGVPIEDASAARFRYLLGSVAQTTGSTQDQIADASVTTQQDLHSKYGKDVKLLDLMEQVNNIATRSSTKGSLPALMAMLATEIG